jgi:hypothetical protein
MHGKVRRMSEYGGAEYGSPPRHRHRHRRPEGLRGSRSRRRWAAGIGGAVIAAVVVLVLLLTGVFSGSAAGSPTDPVRALLDAGRSGNVAAARKALCAADNKRNVVGILVQTRIRSYEIGRTSRSGGSTTVRATVVTSAGGDPQTQTLPVVKQGGHWKVCISRIGGGTPAISPPASIPGGLGRLPSTMPSNGTSLDGINACQYATSVADAAGIYVAAAEVGQTELAQSCVRAGAVPPSLTAGLRPASAASFYDTKPTVSGDVVTFQALDKSVTLAVTVAKAGSGYQITKVVKS